MPPKGDDDALLVEGNALTAMALMIALSAPAEKDTMIALVENFLIRHEAKERATPRISKFGDILDHRDHDSLLRLCVPEATLPHEPGHHTNGSRARSSQMVPVSLRTHSAACNAAMFHNAHGTPPRSGCAPQNVRSSTYAVMTDPSVTGMIV